MIAIYRDRLFDDHAAQMARKLFDLDTRRRQLVATADELKQQRNSGSAAVGHEKDSEKRKQLIADMEGFKEQIAQADQAIAALDEELQRLALQLPNLPDPSVTAGRSDAENKVVGEVGEPRQFAFVPKPHWDLGTELGIIDFDRGVKISGSRFYLLRGVGARLQRALIAWMLDVHLEQGYSEIYPPYMVKGERLLLGTHGGGAGHQHVSQRSARRGRAADQARRVHGLLPAREDGARQGHARHQAWPSVRQGRDVKFVAPETSLQELDQLVADAAEILKRLELPYRLVEMVTGDLSFAACKKFDLEAWAPGCNEWLEVSSCSTFGDFQARRAMIRAKSGKDKPRYVHTLNGSGLALPRTLIAVLENYQRADGSVDVPKVLRPYLGGLETITAATK